MMILPAVGATVAAAAAAALTLASGRNMLQTFLLVQQQQQASGASKKNAAASSVGVLRRLEQQAVNNNTPSNKSSSDLVVLDYMKGLNRKESLQLFLSCPPPTNLASIQGDWNGVLLKNGLILTFITRFITNALFGKGCSGIWNGKAFRSYGQTGMNRFNTASTAAGSIATPTSSTSDAGNIKKRHQFDYSIAPSRFARRARTTRKESSSSSVPPSNSLTLVYKEYQSPFSLWNTMVDEIRIVPLPSKASKCELLIGMGSMAWSGGMLNASPFLLWRERKR